MGTAKLTLALANGDDMALARQGLVAQSEVRHVEVQAVATRQSIRLVLPEAVANKLGLVPLEDIKARRAGGKLDGLVQNVDLELLGRHGVYSAVIDSEGDRVVIGRMVLDDLDLLLDHDGRPYPRDPEGILVEIDHLAVTQHTMRSGAWHPVNGLRNRLARRAGCSATAPRTCGPAAAGRWVRHETQSLDPSR